MSFSKSFKYISVIVLILSLLGCDRLPGSTTTSTYSVKKVSDGDTLTATDAKGTDIKVRFACVDAPEVPHTTKEKNSKKATDKNQFKWGVQAQQRVQQLVKQGGNKVKLTITDSDRYGRQVSEVRLPNGTFIQEVLTQEGLVQVYQPYLKNCPSAPIVQQAEALAKARRAGVWGDKKYVSAWEWRSSKK
ncbi:MAG TPA: nuclease [Cyanobacteria bacterium UBA8553]|nr:nuclease [Cyanobacteria bacterium UBA8553]HAJ63924.1 nuclease [Cyanobacteria bacterium UBA8543]